jgi:protein-disulfide isomerase
LATNARGRRAAARANSTKQRVPRFAVIGLVAAAAVAVVGLLIGLQATGGSSTTVPQRVSQGDGRVLGDPNAPVTVIEYADFQCPVCKRAESSIVSRIEQDYVTSGQVKIEFRMFPFIGQESFDAAQAADAAGDQGKFWEYDDALFNAQGRENSGTFSYDKLVEIARQVGLDVPLFEQTLSNNAHLASIQQEADAAAGSGVNSTPTFYVGDTKIAGAQPYAVFQAQIDQALRDAGVAQ